MESKKQESASFFERLFAKKESEGEKKKKDDPKYVIVESPFDKEHETRGLYLWGPPGTGKTKLLYMMFNELKIHQKTFVHFNQFMLQIHRSNFQLSQQKIEDPIFHTAKGIAMKYNVLFIDEFQVTDIADAMIMKKIFDIFWRFGLILLCNSNRAPDDLYYNGIQRDSFLPFIDDLKGHCDIVELNTKVDYR